MSETTGIEWTDATWNPWTSQSAQRERVAMQTIHCDRCGVDITHGVRAIYENFHPVPDQTPQFRINIEFYERFASKKADLCRPCMIELAKDKVAALRD